MLITSEGIILKQKQIPGNRRMLTVFTRTYGKITAWSSISERGKNKSALAIRPFTFAEYNIFKNRDSYNIDTATVKRSFYSIGERLERFDIASRLIRYLDDVLEEGQQASRLFDLTIEFFNQISKAEKGYDTIFYAFIVKSLAFLGVRPELKHCVNCGKPYADFFAESDNIKKIPLFSVTSGGIICNQCGERVKSEGPILIRRPSFDIVEVLNYFLIKPLSFFEKIKLRDDIKDEVRLLLNDYLINYLDSDILAEALL